MPATTDLSNKDRVRSIYDALAAGDAASALGAFDPEIVWNEAEGNPMADGNPYVGPERVAAGVLQRVLGDYPGFRIEPSRLVADGDDVVALGRYHGVRATSGAELDAQFVHHWTLKDGRVTRFQQYTDTEQFARLERGA